MILLNDEMVKITEVINPQTKLQIAILLFRDNNISSGKAAKLAGISVLDFWKELSMNGINEFF